MGRRRSNYPKCKGCQFNDEEQDGGTAGIPKPDSKAMKAQAERRAGLESIFKSYDVRAPYPDPLDAEAAWRIGQGISQFLRSELRGYDRSRPEMSAVVVGRDMRTSSPELMESLTEGLRAGGSPVIDIGMIDTGQLYYAVNHLTCCGGVMVTASHNPLPYNGFKICGQKGRSVSIETGLGKICKIAMNTRKHFSDSPVGIEQVDLSETYKEFVRSFLKPAGSGFRSDRPLKVVIDASNGMAGRWVPLLFGNIDWLEIIRLNFEHNGEFLHDPNPMIESNLYQLKDRVAMTKADLGVCFDGDADRCIFVDTDGQTIRADMITALLAQAFLKEFPGSTVVYDLRSSRVVPEIIQEMGGIPRRERCGYVYIKKALTDSKGIFGGELTGHYYFRDNWFCQSGMLALVHVLNLLTGTDKSLSELISPFKRYTQSGEMNFENDDIEATIKKLTEKYHDGEVDFLDGITVKYDNWWFNVRGSNTESCLRLNMEAEDKAMLEEKMSEICPLLGRQLES